MHTTAQRSNTAIWILVGVLALVGLGTIFHAALTFNQTTVTVEWSTASELDTVGFNLLRGETPEGPFERVNQALIPSTGDTLTGGSYRYEDTTATTGKTYYYMLEEVESNGNSNQHGPITVNAGNPAQIKLIIGALMTVAAGGYALILQRERNKQPASEEIPTPE